MRQGARVRFRTQTIMQRVGVTPTLLLLGSAALASVGCAAPALQPARGPSEAERLTASLAKLVEAPADHAAVRHGLVELERSGKGDAKRAAANVLRLLDAEAAQQTANREQQSHIKDVEFRLRATERALAEAQAMADKHAESVERGEGARARLNKKLSEANEQVASLREQVASLQKKLDALKRIDLERSP